MAISLVAIALFALIIDALALTRPTDLQRADAIVDQFYIAYELDNIPVKTSAH